MQRALLKHGEIAHVRKHLCFSHTILAFYRHLLVMYGVAGSAQTFPVHRVSGKFLADFFRFHVRSGTDLQSQPGSPSRSLPLKLNFSNCSDVFCFVSRNESYLHLLITIDMSFTFSSSNISSLLRCFSWLAPIAHRTWRTIIGSVVVIRCPCIADIGHA